MWLKAGMRQVIGAWLSRHDNAEWASGKSKAEGGRRERQREV